MWSFLIVVPRRRFAGCHLGVPPQEMQVYDSLFLVRWPHTTKTEKKLTWIRGKPVLISCFHVTWGCCSPFFGWTFWALFQTIFGGPSDRSNSLRHHTYFDIPSRLLRSNLRQISNNEHKLACSGLHFFVDQKEKHVIMSAIEWMREMFSELSTFRIPETRHCFWQLRPAWSHIWLSHIMILQCRTAWRRTPVHLENSCTGNLQSSTFQGGTARSLRFLCRWVSFREGEGCYSKWTRQSTSTDSSMSVRAFSLTKKQTTDVWLGCTAAVSWGTCCTFLSTVGICTFHMPCPT